MVMNILSDDLEQIHAVNLKTRIPAEPSLLSLNMGLMTTK